MTDHPMPPTHSRSPGRLVGDVTHRVERLVATRSDSDTVLTADVAATFSADPLVHSSAVVASALHVAVDRGDLRRVTDGDTERWGPRRCRS